MRGSGEAEEGGEKEREGEGRSGGVLRVWEPWTGEWTCASGGLTWAGRSAGTIMAKHGLGLSGQGGMAPGLLRRQAHPCPVGRQSRLRPCGQLLQAS